VKPRFLRNHAGDRRFFDLDSGVLVDEHTKRRRHRMAAKDRFPLVVSLRPEDPKQPDTGTSWNRAVISTRILKAGLGMAAAAIVFAVVAVEDPFGFLAGTRAFLSPASQPPQVTGEVTPVTQSATDAQALPPVAGEAPADGGIAAPLQAAAPGEPEARQPPTENLLGQFQAWAAGDGARAEVAPAQPVQDAPAPPVQDIPAQPVPDTQPPPVQDIQPPPAQDAQANPGPGVRAPIKPLQKRQPVRQVRNALPEIKPRPNPGATVPREQKARVRLKPAHDAQAQDIRGQEFRAQEPPVQSARPPTFLESLGFRDLGSRE
jgi:hypothetical protein